MLRLYVSFRGRKRMSSNSRSNSKRIDIVCRHLHTSHAFHSAMMDPMVEPLREAIAKIQLRAPVKPFVSTVTGRPITAAEATDPAYWASHARATVEFSKAIEYLKDQGYDLFLGMWAAFHTVFIGSSAFHAQPSLYSHSHACRYA